MAIVAAEEGEEVGTGEGKEEGVEVGKEEGETREEEDEGERVGVGEGSGEVFGSGELLLSSATMLERTPMEMMQMMEMIAKRAVTSCHLLSFACETIVLGFLYFFFGSSFPSPTLMGSRSSSLDICVALGVRCLVFVEDCVSLFRLRKLMNEKKRKKSSVGDEEQL